MTEGMDFYRVPNVWVHNRTDGRTEYASLDESGVRVIDGEAFYMVSGELLEKMLRGIGFEPVEEGK